MQKIKKKAGARVCKTRSFNVEGPCNNLDELISSRARDIWERMGQIQGSDLDIWLAAERMVKGNK